MSHIAFGISGKNRQQTMRIEWFIYQLTSTYVKEMNDFNAALLIPIANGDHLDHCIDATYLHIKLKKYILTLQHVYT